MFWFVLALICALSLAVLDALCKDLLKQENALFVSLVRWGYSVPFLLVLFFFIEIPVLDRVFWFALLVLVPLEIIAILLYMRGIQLSPLSLSVPFFAMTPVFMIVIAWVLLDEVPDRSGFAGILLVALGAYLLHLHSIRDGVLEPLRAIFRERGVRMILAVSFLYSITGTVGKVAILHSSPEFFGAFYFTVLVLVLGPIAAFREGRAVKRIFGNVPRFVLIGFFSALMVVTHCLAISRVEAAYMISVKRLSLVFSVVLGRIVFQEARFDERILGSMVMLAGVVLILV